MLNKLYKYFKSKYYKFKFLKYKRNYNEPKGVKFF